MRGSLFDRRFVILGGKGGVGKSTVTAALALSAARRGKKVLIVELGAKEKIPQLFGRPELSGYEPREIASGIESISVTPGPALEEYGLMKLRLKRLYRLVFENPMMRALVRMVPGMNELLLIGKAWSLEQETDVYGRPRWDLLLVDAPATGHGVSILVLPHVILDTVTSGPMAEETAHIRDLLVDTRKTCFNVVTLPEEMPVNEALELRTQLTEKLRIPPGYLWVNGVWPDLVGEAEEGLASAAGLSHVARVARTFARRRQAQAEHLKTLSQKCDLPQIQLPFLFTDAFGLPEIERLSRVVDDALGAAA